MKTRPHYSSRLFLTAILTGSCFLFASADKLHAQTPKPAAPAAAVDPAVHAAHVAAGTHPATPAPGAATADPMLSQLQAKVAQLEAALAKNAPPVAAPAAGAAMPAAAPAAIPVMDMGKMKPGASMGAGATPAPAMAGMSGSDAPAGGAMDMPSMMGMMDKMMGMMDKMMSMEGGGMKMGMEMKKTHAMGGGAMPPAPAAAMAHKGMAMGKDMRKMAGMMGMGAMPAAAPGAMPQSALPGFPGASHLYHLGATDFFLDHPQHIALTTEQQATLNKAREQALLAKSTADRAIEQAEQDLWTLTASDQPDAAKIEGKIAEIAKLTGDERLAFIRAVGEASKLLTDEQRKILTGFAPPAPAAAPMAPMKGM